MAGHIDLGELKRGVLDSELKAWVLRLEVEDPVATYKVIAKFFKDAAKDQKRGDWHCDFGSFAFNMWKRFNGEGPLRTDFAGDLQLGRQAVRSGVASLFWCPCSAWTAEGGHRR